MKKILTAMFSIIALNAYCQELWPSRPVEGDSKMGCTACSILFTDPKGTYTFFQYQAPQPKPGATFILSPKPSLRVTFSAIKDQRYLIQLNIDAKVLNRQFIVDGTGKFRYPFRSEKTSGETVDIMYKAKETGSVTLMITTGIETEWIAKTCKISSMDIK